MTMADRSISKQRDLEEMLSSEDVDPQHDPPLHGPVSKLSTNQSSSLGMEPYNTDCNSLQSPRIDFSGESGYITDPSPVATASPVKPKHQRFTFENLSHIQERSDRIPISPPCQDIASPYISMTRFNTAGSNITTANSSITTESSNITTAISSIITTRSNLTTPGSNIEENSNIKIASSNMTASSSITPGTNITPSFSIKASSNIKTIPKITASANIAIANSNNRASSNIATASCITNVRVSREYSARSTSELLSPASKVTAYAWETSCGTHESSPFVTDFLDSNQAQLDWKSGEEDDYSEERFNSNKKDTPLASPSSSRGKFDLSENLHTLQFHGMNEYEEGRSIFYKSDEMLEDWGIASEPQTPRCRKSSLSLRERRYCSVDDNFDEDLTGACGGYDSGNMFVSFDNNHLRGQRSRSFIESSHWRSPEVCSDVKKVGSGSAIEGDYRQSNGSVIGSKDFQPGYIDSVSRSNDSDTVFTLDSDSDEDIEESQAISKTSRAVTTAGDRSRHNSVPCNRRRRVGVTSIRLSSGYIPPWHIAAGGVSVSTQTPHVTSVMIQQIIDTPVPLPNEARGTAASRLHRLSESGVPLPPSPIPLPDIITSVRRDRSQSVPNLQSLEYRRRAREVGQELRLLSDEFNGRRNLSPVNEEFDGHPASYPRTNSTYLRHTLSQFGAILRDTFRGRQNS